MKFSTDVILIKFREKVRKMSCLVQRERQDQKDLRV
jgi:hypothetical protein